MASSAPAREPAQREIRLTQVDARSSVIADLALELEFDVERVFRFVADEIRYEPYAGILRGAQGTLHARAGNSVDKALLLAALLDESGVRYRFARGPLDEASTGRLIDSPATDAGGARPVAQDAFARGLDQLAASAASAPLPSGPLADLYDEQARQTAAVAEERVSRAASQLRETVKMLETALQGAGIRLPDTGVSLPLSEAAAHTWVQVASGPAWIDLDPTLPGSVPGSVPTAASEVLDRLPDELRHRVEFTALVERVSAGQLVTQPALEYAAFADEIAGVPVTFTHVTPSPLQQIGVTLRNLLGDGWLDYRPVLDIGGGALVADTSVAIPLDDDAGPGGGPFDDVFSAGPSPAANGAPAEGEATAEWLEVRVTQPGTEPVIARRTVFDRVPPEVRHGGDVTVDAVQPIELVDVLHTGSPAFPPMLGVETFAVATSPVSLATVTADLANAPGMVALSYHLLRDAMAAGTVLEVGGRTFIDAPNVVSFSVDMAADAQGPAARVGLDIWRRDHGVLPMAGSAMSPAKAQLVAGVISHVAERLALESMVDAPRAAVETIGVGTLFEAASAAGIPILVLHGTVADPLPYGAMANSRIEEAVAAGDVVVVPAEPVTMGDVERVGWWRVDPVTGATADVMEDGSGQTATEYVVLETGEVRQIVCFGQMANWAVGIIMTAAEMVSSLPQAAMWRLLNGPGGWSGTRCFAI